MIPKRIFFYWENNKMSWMRYMTLYSFRKLHPDWQMDLYYDDEPISFTAPYIIKEKDKQDFYNYKGTDYSINLNNLNINIIKWNTDEINIKKFKDITPSGKSNIFKWHQLYKYGGVYSDMDILFFKPIDELYNQWNNENTNVVICQTEYLSIGLMASTQDSIFFKDIFDNTFKFESQTIYQTYGVSTVYDLYKDSSRKKVLTLAKIKYPNINIFNLPMDVVYHFDSLNIDKCFDNNNNIDISNFPETAIGYHWYAGGYAAQSYNNLLNHKNYTNYNVIFSKLCKYYFPEINSENDFFKTTDPVTSVFEIPLQLSQPTQIIAPRSTLKSLDPVSNAGSEPSKVYMPRREERRNINTIIRANSQ